MSPEEKRNPESIENDEKEADNGKKVSRAKLEKAEAETEQVKAELAKALADRDHWKNEYYKAFADTQNLRRSLEEESRSAIRYRAEGFLENLLPALDSFHMALEMPAPTKESMNYQIGFTYIYNQIVDSLTNEGVTEICPKVGDDYNENTMHAVEMTETEDVAPGKVVRVAAKGYKLHDRMIRAAMVYVAKGPQKASEEKAPETADNQKESAKA